MVHMNSISDEEELNSHDSTRSDNFAPHNTTNSDSIILHPFAHQVGGHTQLLTFDKSTLCKPLIPRELLFYLNVPHELVNFVPAYKGVVQIRETVPGTYPSVVYQPMRSPKSPFAKYKSIKSTNIHGGYHSEDEDDSRQSVTDSCDGSPFELRVQIRPFSDEKVLKKNLSQDNLFGADYISRPNEKYLLLLENVASKYQLPCILDLKMGTRQHGDDATEEKRHRQIAKCQASTSASLGVRLCGMQVYQVDYGGFLWYDKYYGRKMDEEGLKRALHQYFRNGTQLNEGIIDDVISRLKLLSNAVENSPSFRFYGTSLLIIHEGCASNNNLSKSSNKRCPVDVRLIDFAHTICDYTNTNGRSSSSPSVLTKSSSADQLSSYNPISTTNKPAVPPPLPEMALPIEMADDGASKIAKGQGLIGLGSDGTSEKADLINDKLAIDDTNADTENHQPCLQQLKTSSVAEDLEIDIESNNNMVSTKDNNNGFTSEFSDTTTKQTVRHKNPLSQNQRAHRYHHLETLREVEHQVSPSVSVAQLELTPTSPLPATQPAAGTNTNITTTSNTTTVEPSKQISSNLTSPPLLGTRKISKTFMGPDMGLLFGLENLIRLLDDLKSETLITTC